MDYNTSNQQCSYQMTATETNSTGCTCHTRISTAGCNTYTHSMQQRWEVELLDSSSILIFHETNRQSSWTWRHAMNFWTGEQKFTIWLSVQSLTSTEISQTNAMTRSAKGSKLISFWHSILSFFHISRFWQHIHHIVLKSWQHLRQPTRSKGLHKI